MRYMFLIYKEEERWQKMAAEEREAIVLQAVEFSESLRKDGVYLDGSPLQPSSTATTVRFKGGKLLMTDGPFAETKEQLAGYNVIAAANLDDALSAAVRHPLLLAGTHSIEVRPIREL
ncbi:MAG TPA: YciI family protein [Candidatus Methylomirabilis sp.]|nr:YciI family protein [Candidatus Methylomirabilis sp.]